MLQAAKLVPATFRFTGEDVLRGRWRFFAVLLATLLVLELLLGIRAVRSESEGMGAVLMLGFWAVAGPFCRSWVDEDIRLGHAALWLQKPVRPLNFYFARLVALIGWALAAALTVGAAASPGFMLARGVSELGGLLIGAAWIPILLVVLSFLGSALGARNGALFAYAVLVAAFALPGVTDSLPMGPAAEILHFLLPPAEAGLAAITAARDGGLLEGIIHVIPLLVYTAFCGFLSLALVVRVPSRLAQSL